WATGDAQSAPNNEFDAGPPGGPYTVVATVPRKQDTRWVAESADASKLVLASEDHTLLGAPTGTTAGSDLYEYTEGQLHQVNISPAGTPISTCGATIAKGKEGVDLSVGQTNVAPSSPHAVSADGSRVFFTDSCTHHLYVRVNGAETVDIGEYGFVAANPQGTRVLLEKASGEAREFLLYDNETHTATALPGFSTHKSLGPASMIVSDGLTAVYFSSKERLTAEAPPTETGADLYRYDIAAERLSFVVQTASDPPGRELSLSRDGRYFYFGGVQGGHVGVAGLPSLEQVYRYDSVENVVQCVSCASSYKPEPSSDRRLAATFLGEPTIAFGANYTPEQAVASENGDYVFFDTPAALVPQDINGERPVEINAETQGGAVSELISNSYSLSSDVYEWRKPGVNGCAHIQGCLSLISSGTPGYLVELLGTAPSGRDVFFTSHAQLTGSDRDSSSDVYDARIGGGIQPPPPGPVECEGDACSTPASAPNDPTPSLLPFTAALTPPLQTVAPPPKPKAKPCKKGMVRRKGRCVRVKKHRGHRAARRAVASHKSTTGDHRRAGP
ncbi:MAG TPA: hypothetical protein VNY27_10115, partial [Solirubrobacteraceae bacterium]|nr:hypothetical protein [Solirubrobacteraceae bacterium]